MTAPKPASLPAATMEDRAIAARAARALRLSLADPSTMGAKTTGHIDCRRPRRAIWFATWANLPGFWRYAEAGGVTYRHDCLPGWIYTRREVVGEMIPDLEALAERGERPTGATS